MSSRVAKILIPILIAAPVWGEGAPGSSGKATIAAVWKLQKLDFHYFGRTSRYSCDGMSDKVRSLLIRMGARRDMKVLAYGCEYGRVRLEDANPGLSIEFWAPHPAAADKAASGANANLIDARYESFAFHQDVFQNLDIGDCELIEEFAHQILPKFSTRAVEQNIACVPYQHATGSYRLSGEVLKAVMRPGEAAVGGDRAH
jgi:hypothetical protein